jgi:hypothetical protein
MKEPIGGRLASPKVFLSKRRIFHHTENLDRCLTLSVVYLADGCCVISHRLLWPAAHQRSSQNVERYYSQLDCLLFFGFCPL